MTRTTQPFDAVLLISFGGPEGLADIRPFLRNVLRGRRIPEARIEAVAKHYELFDGLSPLTAITRRQAEGLRDRLQESGPQLPVFIGMRNWRPFLDDTLVQMGNAGISRALGIILAAQHSYSSCGQYRQNITDARVSIQTAGHRDIEIHYVGGWHTHPGFIKANVEHILSAQSELPARVRDQARIIFTAHSIPKSMAHDCRYEIDLKESARSIAAELGTDNWHLVYQSRSGRPGDPWLEPDICDYLREEKERGLTAAVIAPIGFVADHIEVLYDLDTEAADVCQTLGIPMARAAAVNEHPAFIDTLADLTMGMYHRAAHGRLLPITSVEPPSRLEGPPLAR